jgi:hypothetical protein
MNLSAASLRLMRYNMSWRAPAHCGMANLVRSGTKQPQSFTASAADQARQPSSVSHPSVFHSPTFIFASIVAFSIVHFGIVLILIAHQNES